MARKAERGAEGVVVQRGAAGVQKRAVRKDGWTEATREGFLDVLRATANVRESARAVGKSGASAYQLKRRDAGFAAAWREVLDEGYAELELMLMRHALHGTERTETVREGGGKHGRVKSVKTVHSYPLSVAMRLHQAHQKEVAEHRAAMAVEAQARAAEAQARAAEAEALAAMGGERPDDPVVMARVRQVLSDMRVRLGLEAEVMAEGGAGGHAGGG